MRRGRVAWLATERAFLQMADDLSLDAERAMVLVRRLLNEALDSSPTADEIVRRWRDDDDRSLAEQLITQALLEVVSEIPEEPQRRLMLHIERILDRLELANARQRADTERARAALAKHRHARAEAREAAARISAEELAGRAAKFEVDLEVERRVRERLEALAIGPAPLPPQAVHRLQQQDLEHQHAIEGRPAALRAVRARHRPLQLRAEHREIHQRGDPLEVIALR
jgi:hypothetical protein